MQTIPGLSNDCTINLKEVAYDKPANQSSVYSGCSASRAVDGNVNTYMHTNIEQSPYWIVDLDKTYQIKRIEIFNRNRGSKTTGERLRDLDIIIGPSHNETHICAHYVGPAQLGANLCFKCGHVENARYVKLRLTGTNYLHVAEVKVYAMNDSST
ncbi:fucolectin-6-like [Mytilus californianus]|uniref:fucolectin-6-like n=1 Tax=Mytilus californianus TaxID=6549 RepID=UPI002247273F|nr:fucolectin-6-like [Mytilus californianus]